MTDTRAAGASYRAAGVDIAAGDALVEAIKPAARADSAASARCST
jgi:phosphoribosylformylglycinamidine cyclo-ligase